LEIELKCSKVPIGSRRRDVDEETQLEITTNKLIAVFGREDDLIKNKRDQDVSV
jgi:hypothetical protein